MPAPCSRRLASRIPRDDWNSVIAVTDVPLHLEGRSATVRARPRVSSKAGDVVPIRSSARPSAGNATNPRSALARPTLRPSASASVPLREQERFQPPASDAGARSMNARNNPRGVHWRVVVIAREIAWRNRRKRRVDRVVTAENVAPEASMDRTHQRAVWRDAHSRERERRVERRPHERAIVGSPFRRRLIEDVEQRPHPLEARRFGQLLIRREQLMGRVEVRERVEEERQASGFPGEETADERRQGAKARRRRAPARGAPRGARPARRLDPRGFGSCGRKSRTCRHVAAGLSSVSRSGPRAAERLVVERREAVIEQRGGPVGEDRRDQLVVGHLSPQDRVAPHRRIERQRNGVAGLLVRGAEQCLEASLDRGVAGVLSVRGIERDADDVEDDAGCDRDRRCPAFRRGGRPGRPARQTCGQLAAWRRPRRRRASARRARGSVPYS